MSLVKNLAPFVVCLLLSLGIAWGVGMASGVEYEASTTLIVRVPDSFEERMRGVTGESPATIEAVLRSPILIRKVVDKWQLGELPVFKSEPDVAAAIASRLEARRVDPAGATYEVTCRSTDPLAAQVICKALLVGGYEDFFSDGPARIKSGALVLIRQAERKLQSDVEKARRALAEYRETMSRKPGDGKKGESESAAAGDREELQLSKSLADAEALLAAVTTKISEALKEAESLESTFVVVSAPEVVKEVRPRLRPTLLYGAIIGGVAGLLLSIGRIASNRLAAG